MVFADFIKLLEVSHRQGDEYICRCPAHEDKQPSFSAREGSDGRILINCHAGCMPSEICRALGLEVKDLFADAKPSKGRKRLPMPITVALKEDEEVLTIEQAEVDKLCDAMTPLVYTYLEERRHIGPEVADCYKLGLREDDKRIAIPIRDHRDRWRNIRLWLAPELRKPGSTKMLSWGKGYGSTLLYPLDQLKEDAIVFCEGELDALALISAGIPAVTVTNGATVALDAYTASRFAGRNVTILTDNDRPGEKGAQMRANALEPHANSVAIAEWPADRPEKWDVTDELSKHGPESIAGLIEKAAEQQLKGDLIWT